jgi:hypothetical protein
MVDVARRLALAITAVSALAPIVYRLGLRCRISQHILTAKLDAHGGSLK